MTGDPPRADPRDAVVEPSPHGDNVATGLRALNQRLRQQEILAELGVAALKGTSFSDLLEHTVKMAAEGLEAEFCKVLEYLPHESRLLLRAGVGWDPGLVGKASVGADLESPSGFALKTGKPVISNHLEDEERFRTPELLRIHGVRRAINVILQGEGAPFGVLEVDSRSKGEFTEQDIAFLQGAANILGMAIERQRRERQLRDALEHHKVLVGEINHRVKNSLQLVASMCSLQAIAASDPALVQSLQETVGRINAIARIHERLYQSPQLGSIDLADYLADVCADLGAFARQHRLVYEPDGAVAMSTDRAVRVALLATELITNAAKHAYPGSVSGVIIVRLTSSPGCVLLSVSDRGQGLPAAFDIAQSRSLGMKIVRALIDQMAARLDIKTAPSGGAEFIVTIPLRAS